MSRIVAMNYEMVSSGNRKILARVTIVDENESVILDEYVKPTALVTDYRSFNTLIKKHHLKNGSDFSVVRNKVANIINGCILVGYSQQIVLEALNLCHPESKLRDLYKFDHYMMSDELRRRMPPHILETLADLVMIFGKYMPIDSADYAKICMYFYRNMSFVRSRTSEDYYYPSWADPFLEQKKCL